MSVYIVRAFMSFLEAIARVLIINRNFPKSVSFQYDIEYSDGLKLDVFYPKGKTDCPVLLYMHGGGWVTGSRKTCRRECAAMAEGGYTVFNIDYRLAPEHPHPAQLEDATRALDWIKNNASDYSADISNLFVGGSSAGAHLALMTAYEEKSRYTINGLVLIYGVYDLTEARETGFPMIKSMVKAYLGQELTDVILKELSPIELMNETTPPVFITAGVQDKLYGQSLDLLEKVKEFNVPYVDMIFRERKEKAQHGFFHFHYRDCTIRAYEGIKEFMKEHIKKESV